MLTFTLAQMKKLNPCTHTFMRCSKLLKHHSKGPYSVADAFGAGCDLGDVVWVLSALLHNDKDINLRLSSWMNDVATHVLHIYERTESGDAPRKAILASRKFIREEISNAARYAAGAAVGITALAAVGTAERKWQRKRLVEWFSEKEPRCLPLPRKPT